MSKGLKVTLIVSIIINVLFIGIVIGHFSKRAERWGRMRTQMGQSLGTMPEDKKEIIVSAMKELRKSTQGTKKELDRTQRDIMDTLTAKSFDSEKFFSEVTKLHDLHGVMAFSMAETVSALAENLNQEEREMLSEFIREMRDHKGRPGGPPDRRPPRHDRFRPDGPPGPGGPPGQNGPPGRPHEGEGY